MKKRGGEFRLLGDIGAQQLFRKRLISWGLAVTNRVSR